MLPECHHILHNGNKCRAIALRGKPHCKHHAPGRRRRTPKPRIHRTILLRTIPEITNRRELQEVLSLTLQALANNSISVYRAQALITSLQLMAKTM